jgi:hypothetical protein
MVRDLAVMLDCTVEELTVVFRAARVARKRHCRWSGDGHARHKDQEGGSRFVCTAEELNCSPCVDGWRFMRLGFEPAGARSRPVLEKSIPMKPASMSALGQLLTVHLVR